MKLLKFVKNWFKQALLEDANAKKFRNAKSQKYLASDGKTIILVGRNNLQNEELTFKIARKEELWFHAKDIPGSHVGHLRKPQSFWRSQDRCCRTRSLLFERTFSNLVQVDMIEVKKLNKPTGGKPGFVTYTGQKTRVTPDSEKIESIKM